MLTNGVTTNGLQDFKAFVIRDASRDSDTTLAPSTALSGMKRDAFHSRVTNTVRLPKDDGRSDVI